MPRVDGEIDGTLRLRTTTGRSPSAACARSTATSACWCARWRTSWRTAPMDLRQTTDGCGAQRQLHPQEAGAVLRSALHDAHHARSGVQRHAARRSKGVRTGDIAKRLIDYGFHPYTVSFPLIVHGALMIEPTETESKEELDLFIDAMMSIARKWTKTRNSYSTRRTRPASPGWMKSARPASRSCAGSHSSRRLWPPEFHPRDQRSRACFRAR